MATAFRNKKNWPLGVGTLNTAIDDNDLTIVLDAGQGADFPSATFTISIDEEIILIDSRSTDTLTVNASGRGYDSSTAAAHAEGTAINNYQIVKDFTDIETAVNTIENKLDGTNPLVLDDVFLKFGTDSDIKFGYDETTNDRGEWRDAADNVLAYLKDLGTTGLFGVTGRIEAPQIGIAADTDLLQLASAALTVNGTISALADTDATFIFGRARIYSSSSDAMTIAHFDVANDVSFALKQNSSADTILNAASGRTVFFRINNSTIASYTSSVFDVSALLQAKQGSASDAVKVGGVAYVNTTAVGNVGTGEDDLMTYTIPASTLGTNNDSIWFEMTFKTAANGNNKNVKVKFGATTIYETGAGAEDDQRLYIAGRIYRTGAATQIARATAEVDGGTVTWINAVLTSSPAETLSGAVVLKATGEATNNDDVQQLSMIVGWEPANT